jgi:hypothetical protein
MMSKKIYSFKVAWTGAHDEVLRRRWLSASASEIAIDVSRSRNSVIGRARRLGLENKAPTRPRKALKALRDRPLPRPAPPTEPPPAPESDHSKSAIVADLLAAPDVYDHRPGKSIGELDVYDCRFPLGDIYKGDFRYCGGTAAKRFGYCGHHTQRMGRTVAGGGEMNKASKGKGHQNGGDT